MPELTPADIVSALQSRGWEASIVSSDDVSHMVPTKSTGILKCVDGRGSDNKKFGGPKLPGGIYAIAHNRHSTKLSDITSITKEVSAAGFVPSVHGDDSSNMLGCGFFKLWVTGRFDDMGYPRPEFDSEQGAKAVKKAGGVIEMHHGKHTEKLVYINLCPDTTIEPDENDQRFVVDAWIGGRFNLDIPKFLVGAAATVEMLGGPKIAKIILPAPPKPLTPEDIVGALKSRGWAADIVTSNEVTHMVPTNPTGILKCVDGRGSDNKKFGGPKLPGGIYAIAHNRHATKLSDVTSISKEVSSTGFVPSVHGDDSSDMLGCGFFKLWITGRFDDMGYPRPEFDANQGAKAVKDAGGVIEMHHGKHTEKVVYINLCPYTTIEPDENDQRFVVDAWIGGKFNLDIPKFLVGAAATVEMLGGPKIAKIIVPAPPLTPDDIVGALKSRGWKADIVTSDDVASEMVPTESSGILKCVDGRGSDNTKFGGPKLPGGIYAIAHNRHATKLSDVTAIAKEVSGSGFVPSVHGDDSSDMLGCGFFKLWVTGRFDDMGYPRPEFDADQGAKAVKEAGGVIEMHQGKHTEKLVYINLCPDTTIEPKAYDQRFVVDAWIGGKFNLDIPKFLVGAAATVEMLGGPKIAKIIVPTPPKKLTPADIAAALKSRGWEADIVSSDDVASEMVPTKSSGILKCVDGRGSDNTKFGGPKLPGGIYAIAHNRHATKLSDITAITKEVAASFVPSVHGDDSSDMLGCGFFKLWVTGRFDDMGYPRPEFDADQGANTVKNAGGVIEMHQGKHTEKLVYINLCPDTTIEPKAYDQRFVVDAWIGEKFDLDIPKFLVGAAATVEMLGGPKKAKIIVPAEKKSAFASIFIATTLLFGAGFCGMALAYMKGN